MNVFIRGEKGCSKGGGERANLGESHHVEIKKRGLEKRTARAGQGELKSSYCGKRGQHFSLLMLPGKLSSQVQMRNHT